MTDAHTTEAVGIWTCPECKSPLMECSSGACCPDDKCSHRRIRLGKMPLAVKRRNHALIAGFPECLNFNGDWYVGDDRFPGARLVRYEKIGRKITKILNAMPLDLLEGEIIAVEGCDLIKLGKVGRPRIIVVDADSDSEVDGDEYYSEEYDHD